MDGKLRAAAMNLSISAALGADRAIISESTSPTDLCLNADSLRMQGSSLFLSLMNHRGTDGASQSLADATPELDAFISTGNVNEMIEVPAMEKVIGCKEAISLLSGGAEESLEVTGQCS